jgi:hypothetical protein
MLFAWHDALLMRMPCREHPDAKEEGNDRTDPEEPPLPNIGESRRIQSESFKSRNRIHERSNNSRQTLKDEKCWIRNVSDGLCLVLPAESNERFEWNKVAFKRVYIARIQLEPIHIPRRFHHGNRAGRAGTSLLVGLAN